MGTAVVRSDCLLNAHTAREKWDYEDVGKLMSRWKMDKIRRWKMEIRDKILRRNHFRWRRMQPSEEYEN